MDLYLANLGDFLNLTRCSPKGIKLQRRLLSYRKHGAGKALSDLVSEHSGDLTGFPMQQDMI